LKSWRNTIFFSPLCVRNYFRLALLINININNSVWRENIPVYGTHRIITAPSRDESYKLTNVFLEIRSGLFCFF